MNLIKELQKYLYQQFPLRIGLKFVNFEVGIEQMPYAVLQSFKVSDKFFFPEVKVVKANIQILTDTRSNTECLKFVELVEYTFKDAIPVIGDFRIISTVVNPSTYHKDKDGKWVGEIELVFSIIVLN